MNKLKIMLLGFYKYKDLLYELVTRDIKIRYRRSVLGLLWTILNPILMMLVMTVVFSQLFRFEIENYPIYFFAGNILFSFLTESTTNSLHSILKEKTVLALTLNPMYHFITYLRNLVLYGTVPSFQDNIICFLIGVTFLSFGLFVFYKKQDKFILYI